MAIGDVIGTAPPFRFDMGDDERSRKFPNADVAREMGAKFRAAYDEGDPAKQLAINRERTAKMMQGGGGPGMAGGIAD